jgi:hypothetical protein
MKYQAVLIKTLAPDAFSMPAPEDAEVRNRRSNSASRHSLRCVWKQRSPYRRVGCGGFLARKKEKGEDARHEWHSIKRPFDISR